ncbi:hypothetical protein CW362_06780 [Streptomyces populi]|uniref:Uncharacterized protein n=1 Tax=Streptomyces populi TaxID=2058924 RepID=A0A2I0SV08_9ACTN|nr:hypothetical protein [Streptomyces populi]PKT73752.1 hypothetical protein CW362_06780 [Streptomyces populi]
MAESLPADVADVLDAVLATDDPAHLALRRQLPHLRVRERCACGCGTAFFDVDTDAAARAPVDPGTVVAAEATLFTESGECPGEVLVFTRGGYLSWLEVCSWSDGGPVTPAAARRWLRARDEGSA